MQVSVWAYAYEFMDESMVPDHVFDREAKLIDPNMRTSYKGKDNRAIDQFFREVFFPDSGMWIHKHPNLEGVERTYHALKAMKASKSRS